jgi:hypothetical protein
MNDSQTAPASPPPNTAQLTQVRVPLEEADEAFSSRDASGRIPIVVVPVKPNRIRNELVGAGLLVIVAGILAEIIFDLNYLIPAAIAVGLVLVILGVYQSFFLRIPEGVSGLLVRAGKFQRIVSSGTHLVPPWFLVSHLVSRREIPLDAPAV